MFGLLWLFLSISLVNLSVYVTNMQNSHVFSWLRFGYTGHDWDQALRIREAIDSSLVIGVVIYANLFYANYEIFVICTITLGRAGHSCKFSFSVGQETMKRCNF